MHTQPHLQLLPEHESTSQPLFSSPQEYEKWVESYRAAVVPILNDLDRKLAISWREFFSRGF